VDGLDPVEVERATHIQATPQVVWRLVTDPQCIPEWLAFADRVDVLDGSGRGQLQRIRYRSGWRRMEAVRVVSAFETMAWVQWDLVTVGDGVPASPYRPGGRLAVEMEPTGAGTFVRFHSHPQRSAPAEPIRARQRRQAGRDLKRSLDLLRRHSEREERG
jgi:uncharacterized protein YndB with AHSA1/START domain